LDIAYGKRGRAPTLRRSAAGGAFDIGDRIQRRMEAIASLHQASDAPSAYLIH